MGDFIFFLIAFAAAVILQNGIKQLRDRVDNLQRQIDRLKTEAIKPAMQENDVHMAHSYERKQEEPAAPVTMKPIVKAAAAPGDNKTQEKTAFYSKKDNNTAHDTIEHQPKTLEQQFGGKAFVWLGGVALLLPDSFMVKYSIETGLLSPAVRVTLGLIFGVSLLGAGYWVRSQQRIANGTRIAQALSGAGIADLYTCLFAATSLYNLVPSFVGFSAMAVVTAIAIVLSLRQGVMIAALGLVGGFFTPALVGSTSPSAPLLFLYLYFVLTGLMVVIRKQGWWPMAIPTVLGAFIWVLLWLFGGNFVPEDALCLGLFLMAISVTVVMTSQPQDNSDDMDYLFKPSSLFNYLALGGATGLMGLTAARSGFGMMDWGLFGLISAGGIGLAGLTTAIWSGSMAFAGCERRHADCMEL